MTHKVNQGDKDHWQQLLEGGAEAREAATDIEITRLIGKVYDIHRTLSTHHEFLHTNSTTTAADVPSAAAGPSPSPLAPRCAQLELPATRVGGRLRAYCDWRS